jgi:hypothetical protein
VKDMAVWRENGGEYYEKDTWQCGEMVVNIIRKTFGSVMIEWWGIL